MTQAHRGSILAVVALALLLVAPAPETVALPRQKDRWFQVDTSNFTLFGNASVATVKSVGEDFEQFRAVLSRLTSDELNDPVPTLIYVFRDDRSFRPYKPVRDGRPADLAGVFQPRRHANYISINGDLRSQSSKTIYTMYAFHFLHNNAPRLPLWFKRGLAEYYGTLEIFKTHSNIGKPDSGHLRRLREHPRFDLAELFATEQHPDYRRGEPAYRFDARCWVVVHYLLRADPERREQTRAFLNELLNGSPQDRAFERTFRTTYQGLQHELTSYIRQAIFGYVRLDLARTAGEEARVEPMVYADVLYRLGDVLANQWAPRPEAAEHFQAALKENPQHAHALSSMGQVEERLGRVAAALEYYRKAAALAPEDYLIQYRYADSLLKGGEASRSLEAQAALHRSVAGNPGFAPAWAELAYAYTFDKEPPPQAIVAAETAHRLLPSRKDIANNLLLLYTRAGLRAPAQGLIDRFFVSQATPGELVEARTQLAKLDLDIAYDLLRNNQLDEARQVYLDLKASSEGGRVSPRIAEQVRWLAEDIEGQRLNNHYNEAVDRYNAGDLAAARSLLQDVLAESQDAELSAQARTLLEATEQRLQGRGR